MVATELQGIPGVTVRLYPPAARLATNVFPGNIEVTDAM